MAPLTFEALSQHPVFVDQFALGGEGDIRHISLADAADLLLVAPATANTLGKFARGIADDALSTLYLATKAPVLVAPAMNVNMFEHPAVVREHGDPARAGRAVRRAGLGLPGLRLAGQGPPGRGRPTSWRRPWRCSSAGSDLEGETVLVTAGPTVEDIDPVRFVSNRSTGRMGYRLAEAARDRGARVVLVSGPTSLAAARRRRAGGGAVGRRRWRGRSWRAPTAATVVAMAAAVSDYRPAEASAQKLKKTDGGLSARDWCAPPTSCASLGSAKGSRFLVGFAAETEDVRENARRKLREKNLDLIVANDVSSSGAGFAGETNAAVLIDARGETACRGEQAGAGRADLGPGGRAAARRRPGRGQSARSCARRSSTA